MNKSILLFIVLMLLSACGQPGVRTEVKEVCSDDSPAFVLPNEVVCNHSPTDVIRVDGQGIVYMCNKVQGD